MCMRVKKIDVGWIEAEILNTLVCWFLKKEILELKKNTWSIDNELKCTGYMF